jgi:hypothetical protein
LTLIVPSLNQFAETARLPPAPGVDLNHTGSGVGDGAGREQQVDVERIVDRFQQQEALVLEPPEITNSTTPCNQTRLVGPISPMARAGNAAENQSCPKT